MAIRTSMIFTNLAAITVALSSSFAFASGSHTGGHGSVEDVGQVGRAEHVDREIAIEMGEMFFSPEDVEVRKGETIRFVVTNTGEYVHEFNIGTEAMHLAHNDEMMMLMDNGVLEADRINRDMMSASGTAHSDPNSVLLDPGETGEIIWTFSGVAELELSCNVPGHRESGMAGVVQMMGSGS